MDHNPKGFKSLAELLNARPQTKEEEDQMVKRHDDFLEKLERDYGDSPSDEKMPSPVPKGILKD